MDERKVQRINELTRISRERELTEEEQQEGVPDNAGITREDLGEE